MNPTEQDIAEKAALQNRTIAMTSYDIWIEILSFSPDVETLLSVGRSCQMLNEIIKFNLVWMPVLAYQFPEVTIYLCWPILVTICMCDVALTKPPLRT